MVNDILIYIVIEDKDGKNPKYISDTGMFVDIDKYTTGLHHRVGRVPVVGEKISVYGDWYGEKGKRNCKSSFVVTDVEHVFWDLGPNNRNTLADMPAMVHVRAV